MITFRCEDGSVHEVIGLRGSDYPEGEWHNFIDNDGVERYGERLIVVPKSAPRTGGYAGFTRQTRKWDPDFDKHTKDGHGAWESRRELEQVIARKRDKGENWQIE